MDTPDYPRPRARGAPLPTPPAAPTVLAPIEDDQREQRVRLAADLLLRGTKEGAIVDELVEAYGVTHRQARQDLRDVRVYAQRALGDEDGIAQFVLIKLGQLEQVGQVALEDATEEAPELVYDAESGAVTEASLETRIKMKQQRAASARAFTDVTKTQFQVVGARSKHYSTRARDASDAETVSPEQQAALDAFWSQE